jgi:hypothetical protein
MTPSFDEADRPELLAALEYQRASVRSVVDGLSEEHWHTSVVPSGWTPAGLVAHLGGAERHWTSGVILDHDPGHPFDEDVGDEPYDPYAPFVIDWPSSKVLTYYQDQARQTDAMLATTALARRRKGGTARRTWSSREACARSSCISSRRRPRTPDTSRSPASCSTARPDRVCGRAARSTGFGCESG